MCDVGRGVTVRVNDSEPGDELQVDFGRMGLIADLVSGRRRVCQALVFTPVVSSYWLRTLRSGSGKSLALRSNQRLTQEQSLPMRGLNSSKTRARRKVARTRRSVDVRSLPNPAAMR